MADEWTREEAARACPFHVGALPIPAYCSSCVRIERALLRAEKRGRAKELRQAAHNLSSLSPADRKVMWDRAAALENEATPATERGGEE